MPVFVPTDTAWARCAPPRLAFLPPGMGEVLSGFLKVCAVQPQSEWAMDKNLMAVPLLDET